MHKWIYIFIIIFFIVVWQAVRIYDTIETGEEKGDNFALQLAKESVDFNKVESITSFHGKYAYHVIAAKDSNNQDIYIWVPDQRNNGQVIFSKKVKDGVSKDSIVKTMKKQYSYKKINFIKLGVRKQIPVWEVTYIDSNNRYSITYFDFKTGEEVSSINLKI